MSGQKITTEVVARIEALRAEALQGIDTACALALELMHTVSVLEPMVEQLRRDVDELQAKKNPGG